MILHERAKLWLSGISRDIVAWTVAPPYVAAERRLTQPGRRVGRRYQIYFTEITKEPKLFDVNTELVNVHSLSLIERDLG